MVRWICPGCGVSLSLALSECPYCARRQPAPAPAETPPGVSSAPPGAVSPPSVPAEPPSREESSFLRGVRFALGFLLVVAVVLLLLALLLEWLAAHPEWQPWLRPPG
jgi:hypothetical protein